MIVEEYIPILYVFGLGIIVSIVLYLGSYIIADQKVEKEKVSPYECGFNPFEDAREKYEVKYYLVAILFLIFDLEVVYLFPWAVTLKTQGVVGYFVMMYFVLILTVGFIYEWCKGALEW